MSKKFNIPVLVNNQIVEGVLSKDSLSFDYKNDEILTSVVLGKDNDKEFTKITINNNTIISQNCSELKFNNFERIYSILSKFNNCDIDAIFYDNGNISAEIYDGIDIEIISKKEYDDYTYYKTNLYDYETNNLMTIKEERVYPTETKSVFYTSNNTLEEFVIPGIQNIYKDNYEYTFIHNNDTSTIVNIKYNYTNPYSYKMYSYLLDKSYSELVEYLKDNSIDSLLDHEKRYMSYEIRNFKLKDFMFNYNGYKIDNCSNKSISKNNILYIEYEIFEGAKLDGIDINSNFKKVRVYIDSENDNILVEDGDIITLYTSIKKEGKSDLSLLYKFNKDTEIEYVYEYNENGKLCYTYEIEDDMKISYNITIYNEDSTKTELYILSDYKIELGETEYNNIIKRIKSNF